MMARYAPSGAYVARSLIRGAMAAACYAAGLSATGHVLAVMAAMSLVGQTELLIARDVAAAVAAGIGRLAARLGSMADVDEPPVCGACAGTGTHLLPEDTLPDGSCRECGTRGYACPDCAGTGQMALPDEDDDNACIACSGTGRAAA